jgi:hypothetical protein
LAKYFAPIGQQETTVDIPQNWSAFTNSVLSLVYFGWARNLLLSKAWEIMKLDCQSDSNVQFQLPKECPQVTELLCMAHAQMHAQLHSHSYIEEASKEDSNTNIENVTLEGLG